MRIVKMIGFCTLEVDPQKGSIWLNAPNCILRMQKLDFTSQREKFSMIDIHGNRAAMLEGDLICPESSVFFEKFTQDILYKLDAVHDEKIFLEGLQKHIQTYISGYKEISNVNSG